MADTETSEQAAAHRSVVFASEVGVQGDAVFVRAVKQAQRICQEAHDLMLPKRVTAWAVEQVTNKPKAEAGYFPSRRELEIRRQSATPLFSLVHEIGHAVDHLVLPSTGFYASENPPLSDDLAAWEDAVNSSATVRIYRVALERALDAAQPRGATERLASSIALYRYLLEPKELWARSYTQWVLRRSQGVCSDRRYHGTAFVMSINLASPIAASPKSADTLSFDERLARLEQAVATAPLHRLVPMDVAEAEGEQPTARAASQSSPACRIV